MLKKKFSSWDELKKDVDSLEDGVLYDSEWIQGVQEVIKQDNIKDILDLVTILPWRDEIKKHPIKSNTANKDITKFGPEMKQADQSMESYKWIIPVGNPRSIISQLQALNNSMKSENETNLANLLQLKSDLLLYFCNRSIDAITALQEHPEALELLWKDCYYEDDKNKSKAAVPKDLETVISAFSGFSLRVLSFASNAENSFFQAMYNELCTVLCNIPPKSLTFQPAIIHETYGKIQNFLSVVSKNPAYFASAMSSQIQITLALGTTESILSIIRNILFSPPETLFDLSSTGQYMSTLLQDIPTQHFFYCYGSNEFYQLSTNQPVQEFVYEEIPTIRFPIIHAMKDRTFFVSEDGSVYLSGRSFDVTESSAHLLKSTGLTFPTAIRRFGQSGNSEVVFLIMEDNTVYSFGDNSHFGMGCGLKVKYSMEPKMLAIPNQCIPVDIAGGVSHYVLVDALGYVFVWGNNKDCQCGFNPTSEEYTVIHKPLMLNQLTGIKSAAAGESHTLLINSEGQLLGCGSNLKGQLGNENIQGNTVLVSLPLPFRVIKATAGYTHSLLLGDDGCVYFAGSLLDTVQYNVFTCVLDKKKGPVRDIFSAGHCCVVWYESGAIMAWGDNSSHMFGEMYGEFIETPIQLPVYGKNVYAISLSPSHIVICANEHPRDDLTLSVTSAEKELLYEQWNPNNKIEFHSKTINQLNPLDSTSLLLSYLAKSQDSYFVNQYNYAEFGITPQLDHCFLPRVSATSLKDNIEMITYLQQLYVNAYRREEDIQRSAMSNSSAANTHMTVGMRSPKHGEITRSTMSINSSVNSSVNDARSEGERRFSTLKAPISVSDPVVDEARKFNTLVLPKKAPTPARDGTNSVSIPTHDLIGELPPPPQMRLVRPPKRSTSSTSMRERVVEETPKGAEFDFDLSELLVGKQTTPVMQNINNSSQTTSHKVHRIFAINKDLENKQICYLLYHTVHLFRSQLMYQMSSKNDGFELCIDDNLKGYVKELISVLLIDSDSNEMKLVKRDIIESMSLLCAFCKSPADLKTMLELFLSHYAEVKKDPSVDSFAIIDCILGFLNKIYELKLWDFFIRGKDMLNNIRSVVDVLNFVFSKLEHEFAAYSKRLSSEKHSINLSDFTSGVIHILRTLYILHNRAYNTLYSGNIHSLSELNRIMEIMTDFCTHLFSFSSSLLDHCAETITFENCISVEVGHLLSSSPVYKAIQFSIFILYSIISRQRVISEDMAAKGIDLEKNHQSDMNRIRGLLKPLASMVVTMDRCIQYIEGQKNKSYAEYKTWMMECSSLFTSFSTTVTSILIKQKPIEVNTNTDSNEENSLWLNSPLLSQGLCNESDDPIRMKCLALLRGDDMEWFEAICNSKKLNKLQQRFLNADPLVASILRYITACYIWLSPSCYHSLYKGEKVSPAISSAYSLASQILQHVNQLHQKNNEEYEVLNTMFMNQCSFLLNVQPLWNIEAISDFPRAMSDAYQYLKNEKVIEEDEDDEDDEIDKEGDVNSAILSMAKKFVISKADTSCLYASIHARSYVAENRAVSFEYFSSLLLKVNNPRIRDELMESIAKILEYQDETDSSVRKTHFMFDLEGSSPVYIKRVSNAFASIIESNMNKIEAQGTTTSDKTTILYALAIPYSPNDASLLQKSNVVLPLSRLWSFKNEFIRSKYIFKPGNISIPSLFYTGSKEDDALKTDKAGLWQYLGMNDGVVEVALTTSALYALMQNGQVVKYNKDGSAEVLSTGSYRISSIVGSASGDHLLLLSPNGSVLSTGANTYSQCGRTDFNNGLCTDVKAVMGDCSKMLITSVACGKNHSIFLSNDSNVLGCGSNNSNQLGVEESSLKVPKELRVLKQFKIKYIACGDDFSLFATDTRLFVTGLNDCGQLGFNPAIQGVISEVAEVPLPNTIRSQHIKAIYAGSKHIAILTQSNNAYFMGNNDFGQLGNGTRVSTFNFVELSNMKVSDMKLGGNSTIVVSEGVLYGFGDNSSKNLGLSSGLSYVYPQPIMDITQLTVSSICIRSTASAIVLKSDSFMNPPKPVTEKSLKVSYASWLLANLLFMSSCQDQLELSLFARQFLHLFLRELSQISTWVGTRYIWDEWDEYSPLSLREGSVGMIRHLLASIEDENYSTEPTPFTYINQLLSTLVVSARKSDGLIKALAEEASLSIIIPIYIQLLYLHESMSVSSSCQYLYLDNQPYITPLLLCFQYLNTLLSMVLPHASPAVVNQVIQKSVQPEVLKELTQGVPRLSENSLFIIMLLRTMGRTVNIPYGPIQVVIPSPYYCRLLSSKCTELIWTLLPVKEWNAVVNKCVSICCGLCISIESIITRLVQQPIDYSGFNELYLIAGCIAFYAGFPSVPCIDSQIAVTIGTLRQDGHVLMFRDRRRKYDWEGACVIKLSGSKELAWVSHTRELTLVTSRIPIDSYVLLSRTFDNFEYILKSRSNNRRVRTSSILGQIQQAVMYSVMKLLQFPQAAPSISLSTIRSVVNFLHVQIPIQYASASTDMLKERQEKIEGYWKLQVWDSIKSSMITTTKVDYNVNSWPPVIPSGMKRCNVCKFCYPATSTTCNLCGSSYNVTLNDLIEAARTSNQARQSQANVIEEVDSSLEELGVVRKWMFFDSIVEDSDTKCEVVGTTNWREVKIMKTQKQMLLLGSNSYLKFHHPFVSINEGVYLNVWTIIMDVIISDIDKRDYTCLLQTDSTNQMPGSFYVRRDGSCGIGVYSAPNVIKNNGYHRIIISADLPNNRIFWYVDGKKQGELSSVTMPNVKVVPEDRWSLDETFMIGTDNDPRYIGPMYVTSMQLRRKIVQETEARQIGAASLEGPPDPSNEDIVCNLMRDLHVPRGWCIIALENIPSHNERLARKWIQENANNINRILLSEVHSLEKLGYNSNRCKRLILTYAKRDKALSILECNLADKASDSTPELDKFVADLEMQEKAEEKEKNLRHPGVCNEVGWSCCGMQKDTAGCTFGDGRTVGVIAVGNRVIRGPHWRWGNQDGNGCGVVESITNWDIHLSKGVSVRWDNGMTGVYRWNVNGCFDVAIINEANKASNEFTISSVYGNDSATENPAYEVVDDIKVRFNTSQIKKKTRFPDIRDATLPEIQDELSISSHALSSSYSRIALLNILSLTNTDTSASDQITLQSLFKNKQDNLFQCFLSAFIHVDDHALTDTDPLEELKKEITSVMKTDIKYAGDIVKAKEDPKKNALLYFWLQSFSRCIYSNLLHEVSLLAQPMMPEVCQNLPLLSCSKYTLIARYPERGISFWYPSQGVPFATVIKTGEGGTLALPPSDSTYVLNSNNLNDSDTFAKPIRYDIFSTITTASGDMFTIWRMIPPVDYVSFGMVVSKGDRPLGLNDYVCIKRSLLSLGQAINIEKANEVLTTPISFWTSSSMISHFYVTPNLQPPDSNLVFTLKGENDEHTLGSVDEIDWMLETFCHVTPNPSQPMGSISQYIFKSEIVHGLMLSFENASPDNRKRILNFISLVLRRMRADKVNNHVLRVIADISSCMDTLYFQQSQNNIFSPSFQSLVEVIISVYLMCYDSSKEGITNVTNIYNICSKQSYFQSIAKVAIVMEALVHRKERPLPLEYILDQYMISILVRLRRSLVFQSEHPYMDMLHRQAVSCPNATSLTFRFDSECCSEEDDVFAIFPNADTRNPLLLVSGNKYSQIQTKAATNSVYIEFPFCQMSALQWVFKKEILAYNDSRTIVGYRCQNTWFSVTTDKCFSSGIVSFTFCIRKLNRLNLFIGVSGVSLANTGFIGADTSTWGLMAAGTIWHNCRKQQFCNPLSQNDIVKLVVNFSERTLSISVNGQFQGVAFRNIPANKPIMPAVSFFDPGDMIELVNYKVCATSYSQADIDIDYISTESSEESAQWLKRVPERRLKLARDMSKMGFDVHACVIALEATTDDMQVAADYVLTNSKELAQKTAHLIDSQNRVTSEKEREEKIDWFMNAFLEDEKQMSMHRLPWTCPYCQTGNDFTQRQCMRCEMKKPDIESAELMEKNRFRWGFRLHVLPDFAPEYLNQLTQEMINGNYLTLPGFDKWTIEADHSLVELASEFCYINNRDIMTLFPGHLVPNDRLLMKYIKLIDFTMSQIQLRFYVLQQFNKMVRDSLPYINISCEDSASTLARNLRSLRGLIFRTTKNSWLMDALNKSDYSGRVLVSLDRKRASDFKEKKKEDTHAVYSLFGQLFQQMKPIEPCKLRNNKQPLNVEFRGEYGDDVGGLFRETMTEVSKELESTLLPLFIPSPNGRNEIGKNRDVFIPNPKSTTPVCIEMYEFLGKLMGISIRSQTPLVINLADLFWKRLVGMEIGIEDILSLDLEFGTRINTILDSGKEEDNTMWAELCKQMQLTYTVKSSNGETVELFPGGKDVYVPWAERLNYIDMMKDYRVKEFDAQIDAVYRGLASQVPRHFLKLFTPVELKVIVVGRGDINVALLKENTEYGEGYTEESTAVQYFWNVITSFSDEERELYLKFVWGRSRLPLDSKSFRTKHVINKMDRKNPNQYCPVSHTCFFTLDLPNYSSETICRERLLYAIHNCQDIDADETARAYAAAQR